MKIGTYISSKAISICFFLIFACIWSSFVYMMKMSAIFIIITNIFFCLIVVMWLVCSFLAEKRNINKTMQIIEKIDKKYLVGEVLKKPINLVEKQYFDIIKVISKSAIGAVQEARSDKEEYLEYVESFIHELKTPLTACSLILENNGDKAKIKKELSRMNNLTENILYYARVRGIQKDTLIRSFNVRDIIDKAVRSLMELLISAGVSVEIEGDFEIKSDDKALEFIVKQLLVNSAKYCPKCHIKVVLDNGTITIEDNGIGIPKHELNSITKRGFTGTNGRKLGNSTGMGLYIVSELCNMLNIKMIIDSKVSEYTKFIFEYKYYVNFQGKRMDNL